MRRFDLIVIGTGPAGQKTAIQAAKLGKSVAIVEKTTVVGGACLHTGTIPSKALRETVLTLTQQAKVPTPTHTHTKRRFTMDDIIFWSNQVIQREMDVIHDQMGRNEVEFIQGFASFDDPHTITVENGQRDDQLAADYFAIATGTRPVRHPELPYNDVDVVDSDGLLNLPAMPKSMIIVGGGVIGTEYACMIAKLGIKVTLVEARDRLLDFADYEIIEALQFHMRQNGITLRLGERVTKVDINEDHHVPGIHHGLVTCLLESGKQLKADTMMYCVGRQGATDKLRLENAGLAADRRGRIQVNEFYQSEVPHIYAVGDVIGFPSLASTSMEQGRRAARHMFGANMKSMPELFPFGIYAIPEISMVGRNERELTQAGIPYQVGLARYREVARGQLVGDEIGFLKILVHDETRKVLGVHILGTGATEIVHIGQAVMALEGTVDFFVENVFNYPTLAEAYAVAGRHAVAKLDEGG